MWVFQIGLQISSKLAFEIFIRPQVINLLLKSRLCDNYVAVEWQRTVMLAGMNFKWMNEHDRQEERLVQSIGEVRRNFSRKFSMTLDV